MQRFMENRKPNESGLGKGSDLGYVFKKTQTLTLTRIHADPEHLTKLFSKISDRGLKHNALLVERVSIYI